MFEYISNGLCLANVIWNSTIPTMAINDELTSCLVVETVLSVIYNAVFKFEDWAHRYDGLDKCCVHIYMQNVDKAFSSAV